MGNLIQELMQEKWIMAHVRPCIETHLRKETIQKVVLPTINSLLNEGTDERKFVEGMGQEFDRNQAMPDIKQTLSCIEAKIFYVLEEHDWSNVKGLEAYMCSSLAGKFFYLHARTTGYAVA